MSTAVSLESPGDIKTAKAEEAWYEDSSEMPTGGKLIEVGEGEHIPEMIHANRTIQNEFQIWFHENNPDSRIVATTSALAGIRGDIKILDIVKKEGEEEIPMRMVLKYGVTETSKRDIIQEAKILKHLKSKGVLKIPEILDVHDIPIPGTSKTGTVVLMEYIDRMEGIVEDDDLGELRQVVATHDLARENGIIHTDLNGGNVIRDFLIDWGGVYIDPDVAETLDVHNNTHHYWTIPTFFNAMSQGVSVDQKQISRAIRTPEGAVWFAKIQVLERFSMAKFKQPFGPLVSSILFTESVFKVEESKDEFKEALRLSFRQKGYDDAKLEQINQFIETQIFSGVQDVDLETFSMSNFLINLERVFDNEQS